MATTYRVLGQLNPLAQTATTLFTASNQTIISTLSVANLGTNTQVRVAVRPGGAVLSAEHYVVYDAVLNQYDSLFFTLGITLAAGDVITVYAGTATVAFSAFGSEVV